MKQMILALIISATTFISATSFARDVEEPVLLRDGTSVYLNQVRSNSVIVGAGEICGVNFNAANVNDHRGPQWASVAIHIAIGLRQGENMVICRLSGRNDYAMVFKGRGNSGPEYDVTVIYARLYSEKLPTN